VLAASGFLRSMVISLTIPLHQYTSAVQLAFMSFYDAELRAWRRWTSSVT
jgi:hypothetical protein